jgi:hypothetical protein
MKRISFLDFAVLAAIVATMVCLIVGCSEQAHQTATQTHAAATQAVGAVAQVADALPPGPVKDSIGAGVTTAEVALSVAAAILAGWGEFQRRKAKAATKTV